MIEELNEINYNIYYNLHINDDERNKFDNLTKIRLSKNKNNSKWEIYFPLILL